MASQLTNNGPTVETPSANRRPLSRPSINVEDWDKSLVLGEGSFGVVYLGVPINKPYLGYVAIKTCPILSSESLLKETTLLKNFLGCPQILQFIGHDLSFQDGCSYANLILEYAPGGSLADIIQRQTKLQEGVVVKNLRMILRGLSSIHAEGFVHADLKPDNILGFPDGTGHINLKIADFGLSKNYIDEEAEDDEAQDEAGAADGRLKFIGTPLYMSPESLTGEITPALDIWSLGCILINMVTGEEVWEDCETLVDLILSLRDETIQPEVPDELSETGKDFLRRCFERDPKRRWTADMLLRHPYVEEEEEDDDEEEEEEDDDDEAYVKHLLGDLLHFL